jgi:hypothetical protein
VALKNGALVWDARDEDDCLQGHNSVARNQRIALLQGRVKEIEDEFAKLKPAN